MKLQYTVINVLNASMLHLCNMNFCWMFNLIYHLGNYSLWKLLCILTFTWTYYYFWSICQTRDGRSGSIRHTALWDTLFYSVCLLHIRLIMTNVVALSMHIICILYLLYTKLLNVYSGVCYSKYLYFKWYQKLSHLSNILGASAHCRGQINTLQLDYATAPPSECRFLFQRAVALAVLIGWWWGKLS